MPIINLANPFNALVALVLFILTLLLAKEIKRSNVTCIMLLVFLTIIVGHCVELVLVQDVTGQIQNTITNSITVDFLFILISFLAYLWTDHIEARERKLKSVTDGLDWFWKKV